MAGKEGSAPERMKRVGEQIAALIERDVERLKALPPPATHGEAEKAAKTYRALLLAARSVTDLDVGAAKAMAHEPAEEFGEDDDDEAELDPEALEALQCDVERRYARFDRRPGDAAVGDPGPGHAGPQGFG